MTKKHVWRAERNRDVFTAGNPLGDALSLNSTMRRTRLIFANAACSKLALEGAEKHSKAREFDEDCLRPQPEFPGKGLDWLCQSAPIRRALQASQGTPQGHRSGLGFGVSRKGISFGQGGLGETSPPSCPPGSPRSSDKPKAPSEACCGCTIFQCREAGVSSNIPTFCRLVLCGCAA